MIDVHDIPVSWLHVLDDIQNVCPSAVISGGALRDLYHGVPVKDIDIFIEAGGEQEAWGLFKLLGGEVPEDVGSTYGLADLADMDENGGAYPESMKEVILVQDYPGRNETGLPVQLIFVNWRTDRIHLRFDMGICRITYDGHHLDISEEFKDDSDRKLLNVRRCSSKTALGSSINRIVRLKEKYPDFEIALDGVEIKEVDNQRDSV